MKTFEVTGTHGQMTVCAASGIIEKRFHFDDTEAYRFICEFDIKEWCRFWQADIAGTHLDILDLGYWGARLSYTPADAEWRAEVKAAREARRLRRGAPVFQWAG
ncbi:hypothetical protein V8J38_16800 (plasmid) [Brevundimonas olei]|uniref:Uncharacterized protein n=1 Tax=Brevundimonas olei TaxID=657642 RepID=A0ABZ2ILA5_9CAUL